MKLSFLSLASGSSGNCYYLGTPDYGILIDAGIGIRVILKVLKDNNIDFNKIMGVLVTHDHTDHIKTIGCLGEKYNLPIYATETVHKGIEKLCEGKSVEQCFYIAERISGDETIANSLAFCATSAAATKAVAKSFLERFALSSNCAANNILSR